MGTYVSMVTLCHLFFCVYWEYVWTQYRWDTLYLVLPFRYGDTLYFLIITASTVGYGDFFPVTDLGKLFMSLYLTGMYQQNVVAVILKAAAGVRAPPLTSCCCRAASAAESPLSSLGAARMPRRTHGRWSFQAAAPPLAHRAAFNMRCIPLHPYRWTTGKREQFTQIFLKKHCHKKNIVFSQTRCYLLYSISANSKSWTHFHWDMVGLLLK